MNIKIKKEKRKKKKDYILHTVQAAARRWSPRSAARHRSPGRVYIYIYIYIYIYKEEK